MARNPLINPGAPVGAPAQVNGSSPNGSASAAVVVDGTPMRVAALGVAAGIALWALRKSGFKFNVGVS